MRKRQWNNLSDNNESGKTTLLNALQWALYGDNALPGKGEGFRLHPIDWDGSENKRVPITATVEFELTTYRRVSGDTRETRKRYRLVRTVFEDVDNQVRRPTSTVSLFALDETGSHPIDTPEALINEELPPDLREVFFTDGDRALSFIEADVALSTKRDRVQRAIRSLLGLGVLDDAIKHVLKSSAEVNRKAKLAGRDSELTRIASRLVMMENEREKLEAGLEDAKQQFVAFDQKVDETDRKIEAALQKGDKEKLRVDRSQVKRQIEQLDDQLKAAKKDHSALFRSRSIATDLLAPLLVKALEKLEDLHDQGKIPNTTIPVLQHRLSAETCICGESLESSSVGGDQRRDHIQKLIDDSRMADEIQEISSELYYSAEPQHISGETGVDTWLKEYKKIFARCNGIQDQLEEAGRRFRALELQLDALPDTDIRGLRDTRRQYKQLRDDHLSNQASIKTQLVGHGSEREGLERERDRLLRAQKEGMLILAERDVTEDVTKVLRSAYQRITSEELHKVSELMNSIFLEMIGADPEQGAIIRHAEISAEFDIIVYGPNDRTLNPDRDLNGASRRALTLAFILALTKVSEVESPNVIDTPLGMTSGYVKRSILRTAVRESAQLVLFLTHDEIAGCEEIIDESAGVIFTLTNPAHYPKMLSYDPGVTERKVLRCECDHRNECQLCQRRTEAQVELELVS
ncbi:MAG: AAA family ATPase [Halieaceae bacterium]|nr:AAA family ATPase [Halieaceae bacterium]